MTINNKQILAFGFTLLLGLEQSTAWGLASDADQSIVIDSNTATYDDKNNTSIYTGNVVSIQGSIKVDSDKLVVYFVDGEADKLVFTGNKAKFRQKPNEGDEDITGEALIGEYYPKKNLLILINQATVWQGNTTYSSDYIQYDIKTSLVNAGEKTSDSKRVHVIVKPKAATTK